MTFADMCFIYWCWVAFVHILVGIVTVVDAKYGLQHLKEIKPDGMVNEAIR